MTVQVRRGSDRFLTREVGRSTRHGFSFGQHYDPEHLGFGPMVCHDDHLLRPGLGFADHPHTDLEIVTWVLSGALAHTGEGGETLVRPGTVQVQSAGSGIRHGEVAAEGAGPTRFVQVWLRPDEPGRAPAYQLVDVPPGDGLVPVVSGDDRVPRLPPRPAPGPTRLPAAPARVGVAGATMYVADLAAGQTVRLPDEPLVHAFVATGALARSSMAQPLAAGDAFLVTDQPGLELTAAAPTQLLVWAFRADPRRTSWRTERAAPSPYDVARVERQVSACP